MKNAFLLDTNHLGAAVRRVSRVRDQLQQQYRTGIRFGTCMPAICELEAGIQQTKQAAPYYHRLEELLRIVRIWPIGRDVARTYGSVYIELEKLGRVLSQVDMMLAALARQMKVTLLTSDRDFEALADLRTENWLAS